MDELVLSLRIWMHSSSPALAADLSNAADTIDALRAEVAALRQDAARYRWLRDGERTLREWDSIRDLWESTLDAAIDAALSKEGK